jgi:hypothetical protein
MIGFFFFFSVSDSNTDFVPTVSIPSSSQPLSVSLSQNLISTPSHSKTPFLPSDFPINSHKLDGSLGSTSFLN